MGSKQINEEYINNLISILDRCHSDPATPSKEADRAITQLFEVLADLSPYPDNPEAKVIWVTIPSDERPLWYKLIIVESPMPNSEVYYREVVINGEIVVNVVYNQDGEKADWLDKTTITLCDILTKAARESMAKVRSGVYDQDVQENLPFHLRTGIIKRNRIWQMHPEVKEDLFKGLSLNTYKSFKAYVEAGAEDETKIGRIEHFTGNQYLSACKIGYKACGYDDPGLSPIDLYFKYADGRDSGLTGKGYDLHSGFGINLNSTSAWDKWYFNDGRAASHAWEVLRGSGSSRVNLYVCHDRNSMAYLLKKDVVKKASDKQGYYFVLSGKSSGRAAEVANFYVAIKNAGLPIILRNSDAILKRFKGEDYVGIVPYYILPVYCEPLFPQEYGKILDFMHVYDDEYKLLKKYIQWLPEKSAKLKSEAKYE